MRRWIYIVLLLFCLSGVAFFYPSLEKAWFYVRLEYLDTPPEWFKGKGDGAVSLAEDFLSSSENVQNIKGLELSVHLSSPRLAPLVIPLIKSEDRAVSELALTSLGNMASADLIPPLSAMAKTTDIRTRLGVLQALSQIKTGKDLSAVLAAFMNDHSWIVRLVLSDEIFFHKGKDTVRVLRSLVSDDYFEVAFNAALNLAEMGEDKIFSDIFSHLKTDQSWIDQFKAIRLITLFPEKLVSYLVARYVGNTYPFLAVAALEWMMVKGDERDFALIVRETNDKPEGVVKSVSLKALARLAPLTTKKDQVILTLMKFLRVKNQETVAAALEGLRILKASIAGTEILPFTENDFLELSAEAILTLGSFADPKYLPVLIKQIFSEHSVRRKAAYLGLLYYNELPSSLDLKQIKNCANCDEVESLGLFLLFHAPLKGGEILLSQYRSAENQEVKITILELLSVFNDKVTNLDLLKLLSAPEITSWEKAKNIMDRSLFKLDTSAVIEGFSFYRGRQVKDVQYSVFSFQSASESIWNQKDVLYLKGAQGSQGKVEGVLLHEDAGSYYVSTTIEEVIQLEKNLVSSTRFSLLYELWKLKKKLIFYQEWFDEALERKFFDAAGYLLQKALVRIEILNAETAHHPVTREALTEMQEVWKTNALRFEQLLKETNQVRFAGRYLTQNEAVARELEEKFKGEAEKRKKQAEEIFSRGQTLMESQEWEKAISKYKQTLEIWPFHSEAMKQIGIAYATLGEYDKALSFYMEMKKKFPSDVNVMNSMSLVYRLKEDNENALKCLTQEIEIDPSLYRGYEDASDVLVKMDRLDDAEELLEAGVKTVKDSHSLYFKLAKLVFKQKEIDKALEYLQICLKFKPDWVEALTYQGYVYFAAGKNEAAVSILKKAIAYDLANIPARLTLADVYQSLGKTREATMELTKVLAIDPNNEEAKSILDSISNEDKRKGR